LGTIAHKHVDSPSLSLNNGRARMFCVIACEGRRL
jgi:hypothetical protein